MFAKLKIYVILATAILLSSVLGIIVYRRTIDRPTVKTPEPVLMESYIFGGKEIQWFPYSPSELSEQTKKMKEARRQAKRNTKT